MISWTSDVVIYIIDCRLLTQAPSWRQRRYATWGPLNKKTPSYQYRNSHYTDKTASFQKEALRTQVALYFSYEVKFV